MVFVIVEAIHSHLIITINLFSFPSIFTAIMAYTNRLPNQIQLAGSWYGENTFSSLNAENITSKP